MNIARKGFILLADDSLWKQVVDRVMELYGRNLYYRCVGITQQSDPMRRFFTEFPDHLTVPHRHIKYLELLVAESQVCDELVDWLHSLGIPTQRIFDTDDPNDAGALRIFGYADTTDCSTNNG
ncbi:MAG: hypothetical protein P8M30_20070 [Planctomycetaceae bacterium]|jgi:hypothetical protein|nr:hypothetical protein [Planctomycetaceae bacterium]MDC0308315.1 hypothetical protein [Planctomycetaceae bacterium]MDG2391610.1 hypothetical protein [Planctomycetaceae bacterium]